MEGFIQYYCKKDQTNIFSLPPGGGRAAIGLVLSIERFFGLT
jgi:hypothetical protein